MDPLTQTINNLEAALAALRSARYVLERDAGRKWAEEAVIEIADEAEGLLDKAKSDLAVWRESLHELV